VPRTGRLAWQTRGVPRGRRPGPDSRSPRRPTCASASRRTRCTCRSTSCSLSPRYRPRTPSRVMRAYPGSEARIATTMPRVPGRSRRLGRPGRAAPCARRRAHRHPHARGRGGRRASGRRYGRRARLQSPGAGDSAGPGSRRLTSRSSNGSRATSVPGPANANSPTWVFIATITPTAAGTQTLSATYTLPAGSLQAVRANFRYQSSAGSCVAASYTDHDDLVFAVQ